MSQSNHRLIEERDKVRQAQEAHAKDLQTMASMRKELLQMKKEKQELQVSSRDMIGSDNGGSGRSAPRKKKEFAARPAASSGASNPAV